MTQRNLELSLLLTICSRQDSGEVVEALGRELPGLLHRLGFRDCSCELQELPPEGCERGQLVRWLEVGAGVLADAWEAGVDTGEGDAPDQALRVVRHLLAGRPGPGEILPGLGRLDAEVAGAALGRLLRGANHLPEDRTALEFAATALAEAARRSR